VTSDRVTPNAFASEELRSVFTKTELPAYAPASASFCSLLSVCRRAA